MEQLLDKADETYFNIHLDEGVDAKNLLFASQKLFISDHINFKMNFFGEFNSPICMIHSPKTSGTSILYVLRTILPLKNPPSKAIWVPALSQVKNNLEKFNMNNTDLKFVSGHFPTPNSNYFSADVNYITVVRHPLDRVISVVNFLYQRKAFTAEMVEDYALNKERDNLQTRMLAGESYLSGKCTEETYQQAIENINNKFKLVAPIEASNTVISILAKHFGFNNIAFSKGQVTGIEPVLSKTNASLCAEISRKNSFDVKLYNYVKSSWQNWVENNIEFMNVNDTHQEQYLVIDHKVYLGRTEVEYKNISEIENYNLANEFSLIGLAQGW